MSLSFAFDREGAKLTLWVTGDLDHDARHRLVRESIAALGDDLEEVLVEASEVEFCNSGGLGALVTLRELSTDAGASFAVANPSPAVRRRLEMSGLDRLLLG